MCRHRHFMMYKPFGILSQMDSNDRHQKRNKRFLTELYDFPEEIMPIGRLDEKSEGLLLMTTDGKLSYSINTSGTEKEYYAQLDGLITDKDINRLKLGVEIGLHGKKYFTKPCKAGKLASVPLLPIADSSLRLGRHRPNSWIYITLTEGKFRQVRKMTAAVGYPTLRLVRMRVGNIQLGNLTSGEVLEIPENLFDNYQDIQDK